jgi:hypothetical protein
VARNGARIGIEAAASGKADDDSDGLAFVKVIGCGVRVSGHEGRDDKDDYGQISEHTVFSS